jgi:hypothetical protein
VSTPTPLPFLLLFSGSRCKKIGYREWLADGCDSVNSPEYSGHMKMCPTPAALQPGYQPNHTDLPPFWIAYHLPRIHYTGNGCPPSCSWCCFEPCSLSSAETSKLCARNLVVQTQSTPVLRMLASQRVLRIITITNPWRISRLVGLAGASMLGRLRANDIAPPSAICSECFGHVRH